MDVPKRNGDIIVSLRRAMRSGGAGLKSIPGLLRKVMEEEMWEEFYDDVDERNYHARDFLSFIKDKVPEGLGSSVLQLAGMCVNDKVLKGKILSAGNVEIKPGPPEGNQNAAKGETTHATVMDGKATQGNTQTYALRKLEHDAPETFKKVMQGEISANAGMIEAGFRKKTATIEATPEGIARYIMRHMTPFERLYIKDHT